MWCIVMCGGKVRGHWIPGPCVVNECWAEINIYVDFLYLSKIVMNIHFLFHIIWARNRGERMQLGADNLTMISTLLHRSGKKEPFQYLYPMFYSFHFGNQMSALVLWLGWPETDSAVVCMPWLSVQVEKYSSFDVILFMVIVLSVSAW